MKKMKHDTCGDSYKKYEGQWVYELSLKQNNEEDEMIEKMINSSLSSKNDCDNEAAECPKCNQHSTYSTDTFIMEMPKYLILLLKRYAFNRTLGHVTKITKQVKSGTYDRNSNNIVIKVQDKQYKLLGTVLHKGPVPTRGHYISFIKNNDDYYQINDHNVNKIHKDHVKLSPMLKSGESYILLYEKE
jgi:ubiquitin C-terminal hydrolase